jgi:hypothetical protein
MEFKAIIFINHNTEHNVFFHVSKRIETVSEYDIVNYNLCYCIAHWKKLILMKGGSKHTLPSLIFAFYRLPRNVIMCVGKIYITIKMFMLYSLCNG